VYLPSRISYVIPLIAYSFLGIEVVAVTAFEAESSKSLRRPSQIIAYITLLLYLLCLLGELLNIQWTNRHLPSIYNGVGDDSSNSATPDNPSSTSMLIIAIWQAGFPKALAGFINGCLIFSVLSASNTSLYVASRTLYGMARDIPKTNWLGRQMHKISLVVPKTGVPAAAILLSAISFFWLPFIQLKKGYAVQYVRVSQHCSWKAD
jgi:amino acid transporter